MQSDAYAVEHFGDEKFSDPIVRLGFVRKVYGILTAQLTVTCVFVAYCLFSLQDPQTDKNGKTYFRMED